MSLVNSPGDPAWRTKGFQDCLALWSAPLSAGAGHKLPSLFRFLQHSQPLVSRLRGGFPESEMRGALIGTLCRRLPLANGAHLVNMVLIMRPIIDFCGLSVHFCFLGLVSTRPGNEQPRGNMIKTKNYLVASFRPGMERYH